MWNSLLKYKAVILDLDGTLYYQKPVQFCMGVMLVLASFLPGGRLALHMVFMYRKLYERGLNETERLNALSKHFRISLSEARYLINKWMTEKPLFFIRLFRDRSLISFIELVKQQGTKIIILSDYPATRKLDAINLKPDAAYSADELGCLKPNPDGLRSILTEHNLSVYNCIMIGDRAEKDGKLAENIGMNCILLPRCWIKRKLHYTCLLFNRSYI